MKKFPTTLVLVLLFVLVSTTLIIYARGYRIDFRTKKILGTGLLVATSNPDGASVYLNDHLTTATNTTINLAPSEYKVKIIKDGFLPWQKTLRVQEEIVTKTEATLYPSTPELKPLTVNGAINPSLSPDGAKIVYGVKTNPETSPLEEKSGLWIIDMLDRPLSFSRLPRQIVKDTALFEYSNSKYLWSPSGKELLVLFLEEQDKTKTLLPKAKKEIVTLETIDSLIADAKVNNAFLLETEGANSLPRDITPTLSLTISQWQLEAQTKNSDQLLGLKPALLNIASNSASLVHFSPDESKILYMATASAQIPQIIKPPLIGTNSQPEERDIKPGNLYVYDVKEDKNFKVGNAADIQYKDHNTLAPVEKLASLLESTTISAENITFQWMPDSKHLLVVQKDNISIMEYDATNRSTVYAGPFADALVFPWPNGTKIVLLTSLNSIVSKNFNLYTLNLK